MDTAKAIDDYVGAIMRAEYARIEWAIERAVQDGKCGVKVMRLGGRLISAEPDPQVPYGQLHEHLLRERDYLVGHELDGIQWADGYGDQGYIRKAAGC